jgi:acetylcholinesterase/cholinesterase
MTEVRRNIEVAYPVGGWEFPTSFDVIAQMETDGSWQFVCYRLLPIFNDTLTAVDVASGC